MQPREVTRSDRDREQGSALLLAMILILVMTFMGFGLLTRSMLVSEVSGAERWSTKAFYAADAGLNVAKARLRIRHNQAFSFQVQDVRGYAGEHSTAGAYQVTVGDFATVAPPQPMLGMQFGGGQGSGSEPLFSMSYKGRSTARNLTTRSEAVVTSTQSVSPVPLDVGESEATASASDE